MGVKRNVEWYSVHTNSVALREMAQRNVEWYSVDTNGVALGRIALWNIRRSIWTLNCLVLLKIFRCCGDSSSLLVAWREGHAIPLLAMLYCSWSLNYLCICWSIWHPCIFGGDGRQGYLAVHESVNWNSNETEFYHGCRCPSGFGPPVLIRKRIRTPNRTEWKHHP